MSYDSVNEFSEVLNKELNDALNNLKYKIDKDIVEMSDRISKDAKEFLNFMNSYEKTAWKMKEPNSETKIIKLEIENLLDRITPDERLEVFNKYCVHCGDKNPRCYCWNDD